MLQSTLVEDLRSIKTEKALFSAIFFLLKKTSFKKITVKGICERAFISRAAFYAHFVDKYDLLLGWLNSLWAGGFWSKSFEYIETVCSKYQSDAAKVIKNIVVGADGEILQLLFISIISTKIPNSEAALRANQPKHVVWSNFYAGGIISYLMWQVRNDFPKNIPLINKEVLAVLNGL